MNHKSYKGKRGCFIVLPALLLVFCLISAVPVLADHETEYNGTDYVKVYDYDYYTAAHPELAGMSDTSVLRDFVTNGIPNGAQGNAAFSVKSYRNANQDLRGSYGDDYERYVNHFLRTGYRQDRTTTGCDDKIMDPVTEYDGKSYDRVYDFNYYMNKYPSLRSKYALDDFGAIAYFVNTGMNKKQQANEAFNVIWYYNYFSTLRYAYGQDWKRYYERYQQKGYRKGKVKPCPSIKNVIRYYKYKGRKVDLSAIYDFEYYTKHNSAAYKFWKKQDDAGAVKHFVETGMLLSLKGKAGVSAKKTKYKNLRKKLHPHLSDNAYIKANKYKSRTRYLVLINQEAHQVYIFYGKKGAWTLKMRFPCVVGKPSTPTPTGTFCMGVKGLYFDPEEGGGRCWYYSAIYGPFLFHSVIYARESAPLHITDGTMGASVSHGCVRLSLANAKWIYDNVPSGTTVISYNRPW